MNYDIILLVWVSLSVFVCVKFKILVKINFIGVMQLVSGPCAASFGAIFLFIGCFGYKEKIWLLAGLPFEVKLHTHYMLFFLL